MFEFALKDHPHKVMIHGQPTQAIRDVKLLCVKEGDRFVGCGYAGTKQGAPVTLLSYYPEEFRQAVSVFLQEELGHEPSKVVCPPKQVKRGYK